MDSITESTLLISVLQPKPIPVTVTSSRSIPGAQNVSQHYTEYFQAYQRHYKHQPVMSQALANTSIMSLGVLKALKLSWSCGL